MYLIKTFSVKKSIPFLVVSFLLFSFNSNAQTPTGSKEKEGQNIDFLFVQNATAMNYSNGKLTLIGVNAATIMFSDRPDRVVAHMLTTDFIPYWSEGKDSFLSNPPNANLSIFGKGEVIDVVVELTNPVLKGKDLTYDVKILKGKIPSKGGLCSLFIDIVGCPRTPVSAAGVVRRHTI